MVGSSLKMIVVAAVLAVVATGCQGPLRGPAFGAATRPDCPPGPKPCPRECPDFPLPPGGPYLTTPGIHTPLNTGIQAPPAPQGGGELSVKMK